MSTAEQPKQDIDIKSIAAIAPLGKVHVDKVPDKNVSVGSAPVEDSLDGKAPVGNACVKCGSTASKGMMSWCPDCGYYPEIDKYRVEEVEEEEEVVEEQSKFRWTWLHTLNLGLVLILLLTCAGRLLFNYYDADPAIWTLAQFGCGVMMAVCAHVAAGVFAMKHADDITPISWIVNPFETWVPAVRENVFQKKLWGFVWGIALAVAPWFIVGGVTMEHIFPPRKKSKPSVNLVHEVVGAASSAAEGQSAGSLEGAIENFVGDVDKEIATDEEEKTHICFIYGYMTEGSDQVRRVLVAKRAETGLKHFGVLTVEQLGESRIKALSRILPEIQQENPSAETSYFAKWVNPTKGILLESDGRDSLGNLINLRVQKRKSKMSKANDQ